ncbi:MAG: glycosyltransferase family 4 protein [Actinobacteria bacterium]|nr:glycosyltransferase family 4 protein [Actinomycetota bacterium]
MTVHVLVDGWDLHPGADRRGIGRFLDGLLPELAAQPALTVEVLQRPDPDGAVRVPAGTAATASRRIVPRRRIRAGTVEHVLRLPRDLDRIEHDVLLSPGTLPPRRAPRPWIQTLHDLAPLSLHHPDYGFARRQWRLLAPRLHEAARVVAVSRFSADEGIRLLGLDPHRVEVIPHGVGPPFGPDGPVGDGEPYLVSVCTPDPRKGLDEAALVAQRVQRLGLPHELRIAGALAPDVRRRLDERPGLRTLGFVEDLPALLRGAAVVVVTSRYEGFGFTALEAMACGTPVVAFDNTAIHELVEGAGYLVPDGDVDAMVGVLRRILDDPDALDEARTRGLQRAREHTWPAAASAYARVLGEAATSA